MTLNNDLICRIKKKAIKSFCRYRIAAFGLNRKGEILYVSNNKPRFERKGGGIHAEMNVMLNSGPSLHTIILCRVNRTGNIRPIDPCPVCLKKSIELKIKILTIGD